MSSDSERAIRTERDSMGEMRIDASALYGASTARAAANFQFSSLRLQPSLIAALGLIKQAAAGTNTALGLLPKEKGDAIVQAAAEAAAGAHFAHFAVDVFQTGSGTSTNMNANEVIANRALELLGKARGDRGSIHPNDDVNRCQSSNDVFPSAIHIAAAKGIHFELLPALDLLHRTLQEKSVAFSSITKAARTHLQDAVTMTLGQEFSGYAAQVEKSIGRVLRVLPSLLELPLGGTAVGTGLNAAPEFAAKTIAEISRLTGLPFHEAPNHFEAQAARDGAVEMSGQLRTVAVSLFKIANDIRWLSAGPRCNLAEIRISELQPGSSIMPGKVNPVICEAVMMISAKVQGNDLTIALCGQHGNFELNTMMPVMGYCLLESIELLTSAARDFAQKCVKGIEADAERCEYFAGRTLASVTELVPEIGYDRASELAHHALTHNQSLEEAARGLGIKLRE